VLEADTRTYVARALLAAGDRDGAVREARRAVDLLAFPGYLRVHALATLALTLAAAGDAAGAVEAAREASALNGSYGGSCRGTGLVRLAQAEALAAAGDQAGARAAITRAADALHWAAEAIPAGAARDSFLRGVPENARTLDLAARWSASGALT
jgi:hypothetical protein